MKYPNTKQICEWVRQVIYLPFAVQVSASCNDALVKSFHRFPRRSVCVSALAAPAGLELPPADVH